MSISDCLLDFCGAYISGAKFSKRCYGFLLDKQLERFFGFVFVVGFYEKIILLLDDNILVVNVHFVPSNG